MKLRTETMNQASVTRVLVTGGTGLVGSHLVELLLQKGYTVTCLVRDPKRPQWLTGLNVALLQGDCLDPESLVPAVQGSSVIFHVAGLTKAKHARDYYRVNHLGTRNMLEACSRYNPEIKKFVLVSSQAAAGPSPDGVPIKDTDPPKPVSDYGKSKLKAEEEAIRYKKQLPIIILRPSAVYGPRDRDMFELFRWAARGVTLEITGEERFLNTCYVEELAKAMVLAAEKETPSGGIYFIADKKQCSWSAFREALLTTGGKTARNIRIPYAAAYLIGLSSELGGLLRSKPALTNRQKILEAYQRYWLCDVAKAEKELDFRHSHSLQEGLKKSWQWYRENNWLR